MDGFLININMEVDTLALLWVVMSSEHLSTGLTGHNQAKCFKEEIRNSVSWCTLSCMDEPPIGSCPQKLNLVFYF